MPGTSMAEAADIIMGETELPAIPQLPERGLGSDSVGRTASMLEAITIDRGPRSWRMTARPQLLTRRAWDRLERDLDEVQQVWGETVPRIKIQALGPWSLAASIELADGHRVLTDSGAFAELSDALLHGIRAHATDVARRFHGEVVVQLDEPLLADVIAGRIPGTTDFDSIPAALTRWHSRPSCALRRIIFIVRRCGRWLGPRQHSSLMRATATAFLPRSISMGWASTCPKAAGSVSHFPAKTRGPRRFHLPATWTALACRVSCSWITLMCFRLGHRQAHCAL